MKYVSYEKKEKPNYHCSNDGCDRPVNGSRNKPCQLCKQKEMQQRARDKQIAKQKAKYSESQKETLREYEIENEQKKFTPEPKQVSKMFSKEEREREELRIRRKEASKQAKKKKPVKRLKTTSTKQSKILSEYSKLIKDIDENRPMICAGCERTDLPLSHSHRIRVSLRKDLMTDPNNVDLMCFGFEGSCHDKVESFEWDSLKNKDSIIEYVKANELSQYWLYYYKNKKSA